MKKMKKTMIGKQHLKSKVAVKKESLADFFFALGSN